MPTCKSLPRTAVIAGVLLAMTGQAIAQKRWSAPHIVTAYCSGCHGIDGNSQLPYMPKLNGLGAAYAEKKLIAFKEPASPPVDELFGDGARAFSGQRKRDNLTQNERINMEGVAHAAHPQFIRQAVQWYAQQNPPTGRRGPVGMVAEGEKLFLNGAPTQKILACMFCHGRDAQGSGAAPRLAGQNATYLKIQLDKFRKGDRTHAPEMTMVTRNLDADEAQAVAVYLQSK